LPDTGREEEILEMPASNVLRRILVNKGDEVTGKFKEVYNKELHGLYSSPFVVRLIISRKLKQICETYSQRNVYIYINFSSRKTTHKETA
jgi:hypothetical protein